MKKKEKDEHFAAHIPGVLQYHQTMLADDVRNKLLYEAIRQNVTAETSFLDIGAGTGVWAILAAKLGARRVVAVEVEECLIPIIYKNAQENGVADRIEIIHANSNDVKLRGKFDVIVSELFGGDALGAETIRSFVNIRKRFLAPGGVLIPQKLNVLAAPVHLEDSVNDIPAGLPLEMGFFRSIKMNYGHNLALAERSRIEFLAEPQELVEIDFRTVEEPPVLTDLSLVWKVENLEQANAIASFNRSTFTNEIVMDSFGSRSWGVTVNEFVPFVERSGRLRYTVTVDSHHGTWTVSLPDVADAKAQSFGPVFGFSRLRMTQQMTPHKRYRATPKPGDRKKT